MTQEEKQLLLKDLCARLLYGVKMNVPHYYGDEDAIITLDAFWLYDIQHGRKEIKPYLRPMSSMTDKENEELKYVIELGLQALEGEEGHNTVSAAPAAFEVDFYNKHHFDYRGLIPMGLAFEAPEDMYKND